MTIKDNIDRCKENSDTCLKMLVENKQINFSEKSERIKINITKTMAKILEYELLPAQLCDNTKKKIHERIIELKTVLLIEKFERWEKLERRERV